MYLSTFSCASLSGVGVGAALRATLHHLDGTPQAAKVAKLWEMSSFCKSGLKESRSLDLHIYLNKKKFDWSLRVLNSLHFYLQSLHVIQTNCSLLGSNAHEASVVDEALLGTTRQLLMTGRAQQKNSSKNQQIKWNGLSPYMKVISSCHLCHVTATIITLLLSFSFFFIRFFSTSWWRVAISPSSSQPWPPSGSDSSLFRLAPNCRAPATGRAPPTTANSWKRRHSPSLAHLDLGT